LEVRIYLGLRTAGLIAIFSVGMLSVKSAAQQNMEGGRTVSVGGVFGDPLGATMRYSLGATRALDVGIGPDYFGSPRLQLDYIWRFHAFGSQLISEYAGPGLAVAFAKGINSFYTREPHTESFASREDDRFDIGGRAIFGMSITPKSSPLEFFLESGPLIPAGRILDIDLDGAIGFRYRL
jgi:hypothetical protein